MGYEDISNAVAQSAVNTIDIFATIYKTGRPIFLTVGVILLLAAFIMAIRHKPATYSAKEAGPYNPKFDPLQKVIQKKSEKWRFFALIVFLFGLVPFILELMIFTGAV